MMVGNKQKAISNKQYKSHFTFYFLHFTEPAETVDG